MSSTPFLHADDLTKVYGDRVVLDGASLSASPGQRVGLVGENGVGKSTLLRLLAGVEEPDGGSVRRPADLGFLWQELPHPPETTVRGVVDHALAELRAAAARLERVGERVAADPDDRAAITEYGEVLEWAQDHDLWDADRRAELVLAGFGLDAVDPGRRVDELSGGQRSRLGLAELLIRRPRAVLLDEPTNHLDDDAVGFLERGLTGLPGAVVLASHDRVFLDEVCTDIVDLDPSRAGATRYGGTYSDYLVAKRAERARWEQQFAEEQEELKELRHGVDFTARNINHARAITDGNKMSYGMRGDRVQQQTSRRIRAAQQRLADLEANQVRKPPAPLRFAARVTGQGSGQATALSVRDVRVRGRLHVGLLDVGSSARLLVTGPNGAGKSTLLAVLAGALAPDSGHVLRAPGLRVALLEQDVVFDDPASTPRACYAAAAPLGSPPLGHLGLLAPRDLDRPVGALSTGQRRRVALAVLLADPPDVLLLDEPTNHLSLALAGELEEAIGSAPGAVVVASHDRWLRRRWSGEHRELARGEVV
ncbi:ABC-F family ATP-binding cassette domain-containing protein [Actinokineospora bangkokensis]|uniref:Antibiotic ABC transporter ATP-binding protein n=1 Tax=Actinokineospora bangkokensis TaxID=1193682 RepID=A0A1Q9LBZ0_9PSEU|nr:ABC-F family ATP-binding cassette domain-containing protein [Actinokineospora bangkokensis]OLR89526.1 antibiotic ABC transporter ATP-binding protein [Actinokineospora bangkokensis]